MDINLVLIIYQAACVSTLIISVIIFNNYKWSKEGKSPNLEKGLICQILKFPIKLEATEQPEMA